MIRDLKENRSDAGKLWELLWSDSMLSQLSFIDEGGRTQNGWFKEWRNRVNERRLIAEWQQFLDNWHIVSHLSTSDPNHPQQRLLRLSIKGLPPSHRGTLWPFLSQSHLLQKKNAGAFDVYSYSLPLFSMDQSADVILHKRTVSFASKHRTAGPRPNHCRCGEDGPLSSLRTETQCRSQYS